MKRKFVSKKPSSTVDAKASTLMSAPKLQTKLQTGALTSIKNPMINTSLSSISQSSPKELIRFEINQNFKNKALTDFNYQAGGARDKSDIFKVRIMRRGFLQQCDFGEILERFNVVY